MISRDVSRVIRHGLVLACMVLASAGSVTAEESGASSTQLSLTVATTMEVQIKLAQAYEVLDNLKLKLSASISPVSVNASAGASWLPFPFLELAVNSTVGSGWNISLAEGLRINQRVGTTERILVGDAFAGLVVGIEGGGAFQFDYAALVPGDWNHILFRTYHGLKYQAFTAADAGESWLYQADEGENRNGWSYTGSTFLGYQMPLILNTVGLLAEGNLFLYNIDGSEVWGDDLMRWTLGAILNTVGLLAEGNLYLYDIDGSEVWGDDLMRWTLGAILNFGMTKNLGLTIITQTKTVRNFTTETMTYDFYQARRVVAEDPFRLEFYRVAAILTLSL